MKSLKKQPEMVQFVPRAEEFVNKLKELEIKMCMLIVEHDVSITVADHFSELLRTIHPTVSQVTCDRTKCTSIIRNVIGEYSFQELVCEMKENIFSLLLDESTDVSEHKSLAIAVRFVREGKDCLNVCDEFLGLLPVEDATSESLFNITVKFFNDNDIPYKKNMIALATDNANVMAGIKSSVYTRFKKEIPNLYFLTCKCHSLALCANHAFKRGMPTEIGDILIKIYYYFKHSAKRQHTLTVIQEILGLKLNKILKASSTRWLSYRNVVKQYLDQLPALRTFFQREIDDINKGKFKTSSATNARKEQLLYISSILNSPTFQLYLEFLDYILPIVTNMNLEFQAEESKIYVLYDRMEAASRTILKNFLNNTYVNCNSMTVLLKNFKDPKNFRTDVYLGPRVAMTLEKERNNDKLKSQLKPFFNNCLTFYIELMEQIFQRFPFGSDDVDALRRLSFIDPKNISNTESLAPVAAYFSERLSIDVVDLENEFQYLKNCQEFDFNKSPTKFWFDVKKAERADKSPMFPNLYKLVAYIFTLPHSTATVERIFSVVSNNKTVKRNRLEEPTLCGILHGKGLLKRRKKNCYNFNAKPLLSLHKASMYKYVPSQRIPRKKKPKK